MNQMIQKKSSLSFIMLRIILGHSSTEFIIFVDWSKTYAQSHPRI